MRMQTIQLFKLLTISLVMIANLVYADEKLPEDLEWQTNDTDDTFADPQAKQGGTFRNFVIAFPLTLRTVGPDSNGSFRSNIDANQMSLVGLHPNTLNPIPELATHWAFSEDKTTVYYKINPAARWSDGEAVTADDFLFTLKFMRSEHIVAPWYNNYYTEEIADVIKFDDHTIAVKGTKAKPEGDLVLYYNLRPIPEHFHQLDENWVETYNWKIEPNTGPYQISDVKKGKQITFERKKDWWANDFKYYQNRFNYNKVRISVIRDINVAYNTFLKGKLDTFGMVLPEYWHSKSKKPEFEKGYINKAWFYNDTQQPSQGIWLNTDDPLFKDENVRFGFAHAMNIERMIKTVLRGDYLRLHNHYSGYGKYTNLDVRARKYDLDKANEYLDAAGWEKRGSDGIREKDGERLSVKLTYGQQIHTDRIVVLKEEAKKAGIELVLQLLDGTSAYKNTIEKKHQAAWMGWSTGLRPAFWQHYHSENAHKPQTNNITNTDDPEMDEMIIRYRDSTQESERVELAHKLQQKVHDYGAYIPTYSTPYTREAYWNWMRLPTWLGTKISQNLFTPFDLTFGGIAWIDEDAKEQTLKAKKKKKQIGEPVVIIDETYKPKP